MADIIDVLANGRLVMSKSEARRYVAEKRIKVNGSIAELGQALTGVCQIQIANRDPIAVDIELLDKLFSEKKTEFAGDEYMGKWVYCKQHLRPHSTGWCTVGPYEKIPLKAETMEEAYAEVRANGWKIYGENK